MYPIAGPGATVDNKFTEGDPVAAIPATVVTDDWLNDVQQELLNVLAGATPPVVPAVATQNQLLLAIQRIANTAATPTAQGMRGAFSDLRASANGLSASITVTIPRITLEDAGGVCRTVSNVNLTLNTAIAATGSLSGMASGPIAASTWYGLYLWYNGTTLIATGDSSFTSPTPPAAGYTYRARWGSFRTDATANKYPLAFTQRNDLVKYEISGNVAELPLLAQGAAGNAVTPTFVTLSLTNVCPPTIQAVDVILSCRPGSSAILATNPAQGGATTATNRPDLSTDVVSTGSGHSLSALLLATSGNLYWAAGNGAVNIRGWRDNL